MRPAAAFVRSMLSGLFLAAALASPARAACDSACSAIPGVDVVHGEDLRNHGIDRISDIFTFSTRWHRSSLDGYHWHAAPHGPASGGERWTIYVDDVLVAARLLGRNHLDALPVAVADIACIEMTSAPDLRTSSFSRSGSLRIYTETPAVGLSAEGTAGAGNEINDPGPFRYTGDGGENVDRIGPIGTARASIHADGWTASVTGRLDQVHVTDAATLDRLRDLYTADPKPRINAAAAGLTGSFGSAGHHRLVAGATRTEDLAFFTPVGQELPITHRFEMVGASGRVHAAGGVLRYGASYARGHYGPRRDYEGVGLDWRQDAVSAEAEASLGGLRVGGGVRGVDIRTNQALSSSRVLSSRLFAAVGFKVAPRWQQDLVLEWQQRSSRPAAAAYASAFIRIVRDHRLRLTGSYGHDPPGEGDVSFWLGRGFMLPLADSIDARRRSDASFPRLLTVDASWIGRLFGGMQVSASTFFRRTANEHIADHSIAYRPETHGFGVVTALRTGSGSRAGAGVSITTSRGAFRHRFRYSAEAVLRGSRLFRSLSDRVPEQRAMYAVTFAPVQRFSLSALLRYVSATSWPEYEPASRQSDGAYPWQLPGVVLVDLSTFKRMWEDHILLSLTLRNVVGEPVRFHPAGAEFDMALHFSIQVNVGTEAGF